MEKQYYEVLLEKQRLGEITEIILQPHMQIIDAFEKYGRKHRKAQYTPDFLVYYKDGSHAYIEIKGFSKPDADLRRKLFDSRYPLDNLVWIGGDACVKGQYTRWLDYDVLKKERAARKKLSVPRKPKVTKKSKKKSKESA